MTIPQAKYFILTIPANDWNAPTELPAFATYIKGQKEIGESGYEHWQIVCYFARKKRITGVKTHFPNTAHIEPTRSEAALDYVWKDETSVAGTRFEFGKLPINRKKTEDWDKIWDSAKCGNLMEIPADIRIRSYHTIKRIRKDFEMAPMRPNITVNVFWGVTGSGKSHKAFELAAESGHDFFVKGSTTKWWDGYKGEKIVIMDEFRGQISIEHLLKWFDKYPCYVEEKGGQLALKAETFYVCSNLDPRDWFKDIDDETKQALLRRLNIKRFMFKYRQSNIIPPILTEEEENAILDELIDF